MKHYLIAVILSFALLIPLEGLAGDHATLEITQRTLNALVDRLGMLSESGTYKAYWHAQAPGIERCQPIGSFKCPWKPGMDPDFEGGATPMVACQTTDSGLYIYPYIRTIPWKWWVTNAYFTLKSGSMTFTATVRSLVGKEENTVTQTSQAVVDFDSPTNRLFIDIADLTVVLKDSHERTIKEVDIARLYNFAVPIHPQNFTVPLPDETEKTVNASAEGITATYEAGTLKVNIKMSFLGD